MVSLTLPVSYDLVSLEESALFRMSLIWDLPDTLLTQAGLVSLREEDQRSSDFIRGWHILST